MIAETLKMYNFDYFGGKANIIRLFVSGSANATRMQDSQDCG